MATQSLLPVYGTIRSINPSPGDCCTQIITLATDNGEIRFTLTADTYVIDNLRLRTGMEVVGFYDANAPVPLIYPPQYQAIVIGRITSRESIAADYFNENLVSSNNTLKINLAPSTEIVTANGQRYTCRIANHTLVVFYSTTTRSMPPQTTPRKIIVLC